MFLLDGWNWVRHLLSIHLKNPKVCHNIGATHAPCPLLTMLIKKVVGICCWWVHNVWSNINQIISKHKYTTHMFWVSTNKHIKKQTKTWVWYFRQRHTKSKSLLAKMIKSSIFMYKCMYLLNCNVFKICWSRMLAPHLTLTATSYTRLRAHGHCNSSTLIGGKGGAGPSLLHTMLEGPTKYVNARWM